MQNIIFRLLKNHFLGCKTSLFTLQNLIFRLVKDMVSQGKRLSFTRRNHIFRQNTPKTPPPYSLFLTKTENNPHYDPNINPSAVYAQLTHTTTHTKKATRTIICVSKNTIFCPFCQVSRKTSHFLPHCVGAQWLKTMSPKLSCLFLF